MTIERLARDISALDTKLDINTRALDANIQSLDKKIDDKINALDKKIDAVDRRLDKKIDALDNRVDALALACQKEFNEVHEEIAAVRREMATKQDLFQMQTQITGAINDVLAELKNHDVRLLRLERIVKP